MIKEATVWQAQDITEMWVSMMLELGFNEEDLDEEYFFIQLIAQINSPANCVLVALDGEMPTGFIMGYVDREDCLKHITGTCSYLYVKDQYRGDGLFDDLVDRMHKFFNGAGARDEEFFVKYDEGLINIWERKGYKPYRVLFKREV